jgi:hypothetical protein
VQNCIHFCSVTHSDCWLCIPTACTLPSTLLSLPNTDTPHIHPIIYLKSSAPPLHPSVCTLHLNPMVYTQCLHPIISTQISIIKCPKPTIYTLLSTPIAFTPMPNYLYTTINTHLSKSTACTPLSTLYYLYLLPIP